jgi:hypothetical protein
MMSYCVMGDGTQLSQAFLESYSMTTPDWTEPPLICRPLGELLNIRVFTGLDSQSLKTNAGECLQQRTLAAIAEWSSNL